jgi:prevent-host-death family protein
MHDAKTNLSKLVALAEAGEDVVIARGGTPVVRLVRIEASARQRPKPPASWKGKVWIDPNIAEVDAEIEALFYGDDE